MLRLKGGGGKSIFPQQRSRYTGAGGQFGTGRYFSRTQTAVDLLIGNDMAFRMITANNSNISRIMLWLRIHSL